MLRTVLKNRKQTVAWCAAVVWALLLLSMASLFGAQAQRLIEGTTHSFGWLWKLFFASELSAIWQSRLPWLAMAGLSIVAYAALALLLWNALFLVRHSDKKAVATSAAISMAFAGICELYQQLIPGRTVSLSHWLIACAGVLAALFTLQLIRWAWRRFPQVLNRETVSYVIFGVLTTIVNMIVYGVSYNQLGIPNLISNAIAWVAAVLFAYVVNKWFVFQSRNTNAREALREFTLFIGARLFSFGVDELCMWLLVDCLQVNSGVSKIVVNVIVMVMNFFFSKWFIFRDPNDSTNTSNGKV